MVEVPAVISRQSAMHKDEYLAVIFVFLSNVYLSS